VGKEFGIFIYRIRKQTKTIPALTGKLNGAVGNYNAHVAAYPDTDWITFSKRFIKSLGLKPNLITTQIESHDTFAELFHAIIRINNILLDLDRDIWTYISQEYIKQRPKEGEVGSSTMPHKVNPIDFENSEGNIGIANAIFTHLAEKLPVSRLQRDLSDSTVQRNIGTAFAHSMLSYQSAMKGLSKIEFNTDAISKDLASHPELLAEAIQVILRREGAELPYESLKELTRGKKISLTELHDFINTLDISENTKEELMNLRTENYTGIAGTLSKLAIKK
jgi:adenylosuccinate lyase